MKHIILALAACCLMASCQAADNSAPAQNFDIQGVWELTHRHFYEDGKLTQTLEVTPQARQVKIYTATKFMWSSMPRDETDWHAFGAYTYDGRTLSETKEFTAQAMAAHSGVTKTQITLSQDGFKQIFASPDGEVFYAEDFIRIE